MKVVLGSYNRWRLDSKDTLIDPSSNLGIVFGWAVANHKFWDDLMAIPNSRPTGTTRAQHAPQARCVADAASKVHIGRSVPELHRAFSHSRCRRSRLFFSMCISKKKGMACE